MVSPMRYYVEICRYSLRELFYLFIFFKNLLLRRSLCLCVVVLFVVKTFIFLIEAERFGCFPDMTSSLAKCKQTSDAHLKDDF